MNPFETELSFVPEVVGAVPPHQGLVCAGMGGSALPAAILSHLEPARPISIHRGYDLPAQLLPGALYVALSYSGNTEETLSFAHAALEQGLPVAAVTSGGALLQLAQEKGLPHVAVPAGMQPRDAILATSKALAALVGAPEALVALNATGPAATDAQGRAQEVVEALKDSIPVVYASGQNEALAYITKITYNETAKVPAFCNVFPELNHNEMQGLDPLGDTAKLLQPLSILILRDQADDPRVLKRMDVFAKLMRERRARVVELALPDGTPAHKLVWAWQLARAAAHQLAEHYGVVADEVPLVEEFKKAL